MKMKKILAATMAATFAVSAFVTGVSANDVKVYFDGEKMEFDTEVYIENGRVMVPMRSLFEKAGMRVEWQEATKSITATKENKKISMQVGNYDIIKDGVATTYDAAASVTDEGRTMIPLRAVGENLEFGVEWDEENRSVYITSEEDSDEKDDSWKENTGEIDLDNMSVSGDGVQVDDNVIKITAGGDFEVFGTLSDGYIHVNTKERVKLRLSGANITNTTGSAIYFENADKCFITISKDTENTLTDGAEYADTELKGTLYAKDDLEIKGSGTLTINANYKHGIAGNDEIKIEEGNIIINSAACDGIRVNDGLEMTGGCLNITAFGDAVQSEGYITLTGGEINAKTTGTVVEDETLEVVDGAVVATTSAKGIKAETVITVDGTKINLDTTDNAIDSADIILIDDGDINITSKDKGISGEGDVTVNGGKIVIDCGSEGIESKNVLTINGGDIDIKALDDGLNTGGGTTGFGGFGGGMRPGAENGERPARPNGGNMTPPEMPEGWTPPEGTENGEIPQRPNGGNMMMPPDMDGDAAAEEASTHPYECHDLYINGGNIKIDAACDGIDSNGKIFVTGGTLIINGPTNSGNGAIDTDTQFAVTGGEIIAAGSSGMSVAPTASVSTQVSISVNFNANVAAETLITVADEEGNIIMEFTNTKVCRNLVYSSDKLELNKTYTVSAGEESISITTTGQTASNGGGFGGFGGGRGGRW